MECPLVTIICATYNSKATLRCTLRSVLHQELANFEVLVIGDACTDGTEEIITELNDPRLIWFNLPKNTGTQAGPNNEGLRRARGRYVAFIGHDDLWFPWHLSRLVACIDQTRADFVHDFIAGVGLEGTEGVYGPPHPRAGYSRISVPPSSWLHRRELTTEIGFWRDPNELGWGSEYDFTRRVAEAGKRIEFLPSLGVLKFHSQTWRFYSRPCEPPPQEPYLSAILENAGQLSEKTLADLAVEYAQHSRWNEKKPLNLAWDETKLAARDAFKACLRELIYLYGNERWPIGPLLRYRMRRIRSKSRLMRGLPSLKQSGL